MYDIMLDREGNMYYIGIDIGSTASKFVVINNEKNEILYKEVISSGWNSKETGRLIINKLESLGYSRKESHITATGYGRIAVDFADKVITEITAHGKGAHFLGSKDKTVIDIGGQDTKVIVQNEDRVVDFLMNDKCSAGTGKFLEVMANRLGLDLDEFFQMAKNGKDIELSSTCTVFAESEVVSLMGKGTKREDIASGVINSIVSKVSKLAQKKSNPEGYFLTGGFSNNAYIMKSLEEKLASKLYSHPDGRFAGAIGAAIL
ncbi:putative R-phenyllactate dehydratase activator [Anaerococcus tetradius]|uniref:Putative R-phenyllactate dehydratase activator n=2 Tax=Anaerococcus tetradius TaxID=33036 RepID=A0A133KHQ2_9FIRM|nr:putative R-phenyllactate dehydratase activator [Anaerococcus tetradius]